MEDLQEMTVLTFPLPSHAFRVVAGIFLNETVDLFFGTINKEHSITFQRSQNPRIIHIIEHQG